MKSWRLQIEGPPENAHALIALWHEHLPVCIRAFSHRGYAVLISLSQDGDIAAGLCKTWGYKVFRGSTSKSSVSGGKNLLRYLKYRQQSGKQVLAGMVLDGPRGPYHSIGRGTEWLANKTGLPIYHPQVTAAKYFRLKNWDRTLIPLPFARVNISLKRIEDLDKPELKKRVNFQRKPVKNTVEYGF